MPVPPHRTREDVAGPRPRAAALRSTRLARHRPRGTLAGNRRRAGVRRAPWRGCTHAVEPPARRLPRIARPREYRLRRVAHLARARARNQRRLLASPAGSSRPARFPAHQPYWPSPRTSCDGRTRGYRAVDRSQRPSRHLPSESLHPPNANRERGTMQPLTTIGHDDYTVSRSLGSRLTVGRLTLDQLVGVRIPTPQPEATVSPDGGFSSFRVHLYGGCKPRYRARSDAP